MKHKKLLFLSMLVGAQATLCMKREKPNDGNEWKEIKSPDDLYQFGNNRITPFWNNPGTLAAVSLNVPELRSEPGLFTMPQGDSGIYYARIRDANIYILYSNRDSFCSIGCYNGTNHISPAFIRGLTLTEMKEIMKGKVLRPLCPYFEQTSNPIPDPLDIVPDALDIPEELERVKRRHSTLNTLTPREQRRYVRDHSGILTLCGIRTKRKSPLDEIHKDVFPIIIKQLIALETERIGEKPLQLGQPKKELPPKKEESGCLLF